MVNNKKKLTLSLAKRKISTERPAFVMGIVNCTPDSFYDKSRGGYEQAAKLIDEGADILDLGGESTRPGSDYVSEEEEIRRLVPVIQEIRKQSDIPISVDTRKASVMKAALDSGADILNDVSAMEDDSRMLSLVSDTKIPVILMHKRGIPSEMQKNTDYNNIFHEVDEYLKSRIDYALAGGVEHDKIILDPGIGFGKNLDGNLSLIKNCGKLCGGEYPVMMALSRKTCIGQLTGKDVADRLYGTLAADLLSILYGATFVRVHDVSPCIDTLNVLSGIQNISDI